VGSDAVATEAALEAGVRVRVEYVHAPLGAG
jgi:hypothetical protein